MKKTKKIKEQKMEADVCEVKGNKIVCQKKKIKIIKNE